MYRFIRWYNQNRMEFFIILIIIAFALLFIQILNGIAEDNKEKKEVSLRNSNIIEREENTTISKTNKSIINGEEVLAQDNINNINLIKEFIEYCNNQDIESAYEMLTDECKELIYPTIMKFKTNYYDRIFYIERLYSLQNWFVDSRSVTYYIKYTEDVMATGNINSEDNKADYITVVKVGNEYKLNISSYIGRENVQMNEEENGIQVNVNWIDRYMDYLIANITILNNTDSMICMDPKEEIESVYIYDDNNVRYEALLNEISKEQLTVYKRQINTINLKFNEIYNPDREIYGIVFNDVVMNYEKYERGEENKENIEISIEG